MSGRSRERVPGAAEKRAAGQVQHAVDRQLRAESVPSCSSTAPLVTRSCPPLEEYTQTRHSVALLENHVPEDSRPDQRWRQKAISFSPCPEWTMTGKEASWTRIESGPPLPLIVSGVAQSTMNDEAGAVAAAGEFRVAGVERGALPFQASRRSMSIAAVVSCGIDRSLPVAKVVSIQVCIVEIVKADRIGSPAAGDLQRQRPVSRRLASMSPSPIL